ncbi:MAG: hypothetical protein LBE89_02025 [Helicobacteraceae bacterium]|jgi:hypothetical protein|nr:hypothetical protein [Helicobacteraceae bacterium]
MARPTGNKRYTDELGDILDLIDHINSYLSIGRRRSTGKAAKAQSDRQLLRLLKSKYHLSENDIGEIQKIVAGKKIITTKKTGKITKAATAVSEEDRARTKEQIDALIKKIGITIRASGLNESEFLRKVKGNLSVRKGKILSVLHQTREKKTK